MASIPGLDVTDSDLGEWRRVNRNFAGGPKNPNIGPDGLSQEGRNWAGTRMGAAPNTPAAPAVPPAAAAETAEAAATGGRAYRAGQAVSNGAKAAASGLRTVAAAAPLAGFGDYKADTGGVDTSAGGTFGYLRDGDFGKAGTSLSGGAAEALADSGRGIAKVMDSAAGLVGAHPGLTQRYDSAVQSNLGGYLSLRDPQPVAPPGSQQHAAQPGAGGAGGAQPGTPTTPAVAPAADPNAVYKVIGADGRPTYTNDPHAGGTQMSLPQLNTMSGAAMASGTPSVDAALASARQAAAGRGDWGAVAGSYGEAQPVQTAANGVRGGTVIDDLVAKNSAVDPSAIRSLALQNMDRAGSSRARNEALRVFAQAGDAGAQERIARSAQEAETIRANAGLRQRAAEAAMNRDVAMRGQDVSLAGHRMSNQVAINNMLREQYNADRTFKAGEEQRVFERKNAADNQLTKDLEAAFPGQDGKPDAQAVGMYRQGIERSLARMGADGVHQLSPLDNQRLVAGSQLLDVMRKNSGILPWKPDQLRTVDPVDLTNLRVLPNGDRQITRADSKAVGQIIPRRFFETEQGARLGTLTGTATNRYDILSEGRQ